ncbi:MAG: ABC transporter ATP-binding protein [Eubacterium sp.]|nr:ABC transporter ATP-binding protein [Eubacterium sp.]
MKQYYFHLDQLTVGYHGQPLIRDINIGIEQGEIVTLIGPNGAGKSTILKSITRQLAMIDGRVQFADKELRAYSYKDLSSRMAVVLTERTRPELMTCHDVVATGRYPYTGRLGILSPEDERIVDESMRAVHAEDIGSRDFNAISDGQRQRVLLARAICQEPEIIILDEPTSFLDVRHKLELLAILRNMAKEKGITVIMSLHEIDLAMKISDKIVCVKGDHIFRYGIPEDIFEEQMIRDLYDIDNGFFDPMFGSIELPAPGRKPLRKKRSDTDGDQKQTLQGSGQPEETSQPDGTASADKTDEKQPEAKTLVLSACGTGIPVFRRLQRRNEPFISAILYKNDVDYQLARLLAAEVITEEPFHPISNEAFNRAMEAVQNCDKVIDAGVLIGESNRRMTEILEAAQAARKLEKL